MVGNEFQTEPLPKRGLNALKLPPTVHHHAHYRVWQRGGYDMNIWSEKKRLEKLKSRSPAFAEDKLRGNDRIGTRWGYLGAGQEERAEGGQDARAPRAWKV